MATRKIIAYPLAAVAAAAGSTLAFQSPASAHGYVSSPPSRQALCAQRAVPDCGPIQFEPQSVEGPKGLKRCDGGLSQFAVLNDDSRNWPARAVGDTVSFSWTLTARHRTSTWEYFIGDTRVAVFDDGNRQPEAVVTHQVDLSRFPGRQTVLAVWNIGDTPMAFYNCIDLNIGGGGGTPPAQTPAPTPTGTPTQAPTGQPTQTATATAPANPGQTGAPTGAAWAAGTAYRIGDEVTFDGKRYRCRQPHTAIRSWEPSPFTLALWLPA
ncbi:lytic polysaccharide monooxygenase [Micromonospora sp. WMMD558]|uniref:lytic polysaccharide monooxygenase n=1 Tax=unclassified Micromonospora TaxID=2617518 RepID=UPI0012B45FD1|nr:lytic polysaccharide monooxygenase [Micromonospora sp. WMMC415]QGN49167.1 cellulose-binding protein [Micromonospora sp. WMMC415]